MKKNERGQTSVEYILLMAVVVSVLSVIFPRIQAFIVSNPNSLQNTVLSGFGDTVEGLNNGFAGRYERFTLRR